MDCYILYEEKSIDGVRIILSKHWNNIHLNRTLYWKCINEIDLKLLGYHEFQCRMNVNYGNVKKDCACNSCVCIYG